jgi:CRP/FNR family transcriptional regulator, anaerobic regulatory protein
LKGRSNGRLIWIKCGCDHCADNWPAINPEPIMPRRDPCLDCVVRSSALCHVLSASQLAKFNRLSHRKRYPPGRLIGGTDSAEDWFAIILTGVIKLTRSLPDGRQQIVTLLFPSDFLGRPFRADSLYAAETTTAVELCCFNRRHFEELMHEETSLKQLFLERTLDEVDAARDWMLLLGRKNAQEKVAALILLTLRRMRVAECACCSPLDRPQFELPLSRTEMADYLGLRIETVSRQLKRLRAAGVIDTEKGRAITVRDVRALERNAGE